MSTKRVKPPTTPRIENGAIVPNVSRREIKTLAMIVDEEMERIPFAAKIDLSKPDVREEFRCWLLHFLGGASHQIEWAFRRATDSALEQAESLMRDPKRYERQAASRKERREKRAASRRLEEADLLARRRKEAQRFGKSLPPDDEPMN